MNFYKHYIGDYQRDTGHLTLTEHGAYRLMLDAYYATGKPLPAERKALYRLLRAAGATEKKAIDSVASQFWETAGNGLVNRRAAVEIEKAERQAEVNRQIALAREEKRRRIRSGTANRPVDGDTEPEERGNGVLGDLLHEPDKVFGVCKVNHTQVISDPQPVLPTDRGTTSCTGDEEGSCDGAGFAREPSHSHSHNHNHNQTAKGCGNLATHLPEDVFFRPKAGSSVKRRAGMRLFGTMWTVLPGRGWLPGRAARRRQARAMLMRVAANRQKGGGARRRFREPVPRWPG